MNSKMNINTQTEPSKRCRICGDQAICFNFDALTCGSCRLFFHRNVTKIKKWKCRTNGNCQINLTNRKQCRKCRMEKCFEIGMKPKHVTANKSVDSIETTGNALKNILELNVDVESDQISNELKDCNRTSRINSYKLTPTEQKYIDEIEKTTKSIFNFEEQKLPIAYEETDPTKSLNLGLFYIRRIIKYCKTNPTFQPMSNSDQMLILKRFIYDFITIRYAFIYVPERRGQVVIANEEADSCVFTRLATFEGMEHHHLVVESEKASMGLNIEMENDVIIRDLITARLFYTSWKEVSNSEAMRYHHWIYHNLLLRYLHCKYRNAKKAKNKFRSLNLLVSQLCDGKECLRRLLLTFGKDKVAELAVEILNLNDEITLSV